MKLKYYLSGSLLCTGLLFNYGSKANDPCHDAWVTGSTACSASESSKETTAWNVYNAAYSAAQLKDQGNQTADALEEQNGKVDCDTALTEGIGDPDNPIDDGSCENNKKDGLDQVQTTHDLRVANCNGDADCICPFDAALAYDKSGVMSDYNKCVSTRHNEHDNFCYPDKEATRLEKDYKSIAQFYIEAGDAEATRAKTIDLALTSLDTCLDSQLMFDYNCELQIDCQQTPGNCCEDTAQIHKNYKLLAAQVSFDATQGPAQATADHDIIECYYKHSSDDNLSYATYAKNVTLTDGVYHYDLTTNDIACTSAKDANNATCDLNIAMCQCNGTDCSDSEKATRDIENAAADDQHNRNAAGPNDPNYPPGPIWTTWANARNDLNVQLTDDYNTHDKTAKACDKSARDTYNAIYQTASDKLNADLLSADAAYQLELLECSAG